MSIYVDKINSDIHLVYNSDYRVLKVVKNGNIISNQRMADSYTVADYQKYLNKTRKKFNK